MKDLRDILIDNDNVYKWDDSDVLDVTLSRTGKTLVRDLLREKCLVCDANIIDVDADIMVEINNTDMNGALIKCEECGQVFYLHYQANMNNTRSFDPKVLEL